MGRIIDKKDLQTNEEDLKDKYVVCEDLIDKLKKEEKPKTIKDEDVVL